MNIIASPTPEKRKTSVSSISTMSSSISINSLDQAMPKVPPFCKEDTRFSSVKEVVKGQVEPVIVTHANSPSDFYLQLVDNAPVIELVNDELSNFVKTKFSMVNQIEMGVYFIIIFNWKIKQICEIIF